MLLEQCTLDAYETEFAGRHLIHGAVDYWAERKPGDPAIVNATRGTQLTWKELSDRSKRAAGALRRLGFRKGEMLATSLPLTNEHIVLQYGCFRLGMIHVPLDLRLSAVEVERSLAIVQAKRHVKSGEELAVLLDGEPLDTTDDVVATDGAQVIFTTGSTGRPKAALLTHRSITVQNLCLGAAFDFDGSRVLVNLPPSHVGGQAELLLTTLFWGGTAVTLEVFDAAKSLEAIERHKVKLLGQIPAMFLMEWRHSEYPQRDLSSLNTTVYGGQAVPRPFLEKLKAMAPAVGTGLGLTETSGFCTYVVGGVDEVEASIGFAAPIYPMSIREPMQSGGSAGAEVSIDSVGHVCFQGPQTFAGYVNDEAATAQAISADGFLYTGDMGYVDEMGLHFSGRAKWVIKPAGYQVFPGDVENFISQLSDKVASVGVIGISHPIWVEAIVAFVEKRPGVELTEAELRRHARGMTSYMRPLHYVILEPGQMPLNRVAKIDALKLKETAEAKFAESKMG